LHSRNTFRRHSRLHQDVFLPSRGLPHLRHSHLPEDGSLRLGKSNQPFGMPRVLFISGGV
jgi:hypothetical protein